jgi:hypothetical protein
LTGFSCDLQKDIIPICFLSSRRCAFA